MSKSLLWNHAACDLGFWGNAPSTLQRFCASIYPQANSFPDLLHRLATSDDLLTTNNCYRQPQRAGHEPVCLVPEWTSICLCLSGVFAQATPHILRASYSSDIGITTGQLFSSVHLGLLSQHIDMEYELGVDFTLSYPHLSLVVLRYCHTRMLLQSHSASLSISTFGIL